MEQSKLDHIAQSALNGYDENFISNTYFTKATSIIYKVVDSNDQVFALKIYDNASSNVDDNLIEALMLDAIAAKSNIAIAEIIKNKKGQYFTLFQESDSNTSYRIVLTKWIEGIDFRTQENEERFFELGKLIAEMHSATKDIILPEKLIPKKWNQVFYFRDEMPVYHNPKYKDLVSSELKYLMDELMPFLNQQLKEIYATEKPQLLHGDLNPWNIKIHNEQFSILDFEDCILGPPIHDLAILLFYYRTGEKLPYEIAKNNILAGYKSEKNLPSITDSNLEILFMARKVNFLNHVLTLEKNDKKYMEDGAIELKEFVKKYL